MVAEPYRKGKGGKLVKAGKVLALAGGAGALLGARSRVVSAASGTAMLAASAATRFGIFFAGIDSANDPKYTVEPQRKRLEAGKPARAN
jgi:hypothetical protein